MPSTAPLYEQVSGRGRASGRFLDQLFEDLRSAPDRQVLCHYGPDNTAEWISAGELIDSAQRRAVLLRGRIAAQDLVLIIEHNVKAQIQWWLAALLAGGVPGILTPPTPKLDSAKYYSDLDAILTAYDKALVLYGDGIFQEPPDDDRFVGYAEADFSVAPAPDSGLPDPRDVNAPLLFQQSSGTTGLRKGMILSERALIDQLQSYAQAIDLSSDDVIVSWLPLYHDMGLVACFLQAMYQGLPLVLTSPFEWLMDPAWLIRAVERHGGTLCWMPNFAFDVLSRRVDRSRLGANALSSLRLVVNCSEPVLPSSVERFEKTFAPLGLRPGSVSSSYAMAENTFAVTQTRPGDALAIETVDPHIADAESRAVHRDGGRAVAGSGRAVAGTEVKVQGTDGAPCGDGEIGVIALRGTSLMDGYLGVGEAIEFLDADGWYVSGDIGYMRNGTLFVIGRHDDMIIRAGRNLNPIYLESAASSVRGIKAGRVVAFGVMNPQEGTEDVIVIAERDDGAPVDERSLKSDIVQACNVYAGVAPQRVEIVASNWLAKSSSGKISRAACKAKYGAAASGRE